MIIKQQIFASLTQWPPLTMLMTGAGPMVTRLVSGLSPSPSATSRPRPVRSTTAATACVWPTRGGWDTGVSATPATKVRLETSFLEYRDFLWFFLFIHGTTLVNRIVLRLISYKPFIAPGERYGNRMHDKTLLDED